MSVRKISTRNYTNNLNKFTAFWAVGIVCSILLVLVCTLFPFNFSFKDGFSIREIISSFHHPSNLVDAIANVLLFLPFGFSFSYLLQKAKLKGIAAFIAILITSFGFSLTVEVLQVFLPSRDSTILDLVTNSVGGCLGCLGFQLRSIALSQVLGILKKNLSLQKLTAIFIGYTVFAFVVSIALQNSTNLSGWDTSFPLLLGNERTGGRPWQGYISEVFITNKTISKAEVARVFSEQNKLTLFGDSLLASYQLTGKDNYRDQTGLLSDLSWQGKPPVIEDKKGAFLSANHWLETKSPATLITQNIRDTSQFTLSTNVASADTNQTGPARIISLSGDGYRRNFTLGQSGDDLVFRLQTPVTGVNGSSPEFVVPNVFADTKFHHLIITYDGATIKFYVDRIQHLYSLKLSPDITLFRYLLPLGNWNIRLNSFNSEIYKFFYYGFIFVPLGCLLALISIVIRGRFIFYVLLICSGILLPSLMLEGILAGSERIIRPEYLLLSISITSVTMLVVRNCTVSGLKGSIGS